VFGRRFESAHLHKRKKVQLTAEPFFVWLDFRLLKVLIYYRF
jgi:hypothetical protein